MKVRCVDAAGQRVMDEEPTVVESAIYGDSVIPARDATYGQVPDGGYEPPGEGFVGWA